MIQLDKIKIIAPLESVTILNHDLFQSKIVKEELAELSYTQLTPYNLYIEIDLKEAEAVIEFTGKILLDKYPQLISRDTIRECLGNINRLGFCRLNIDMILQYGEVCSVDVTQDVTYTDCKELCDFLRNNLCNHQRYLAQTISDNLIIRKNVTTRGCQRTLTIYDKYRELLRAENRGFIALCGGDKFTENFTGKIRFELRLNSKSAIRKDLNIKTTSILEVLSSNTHPIWEYIDKIIKEDIQANDCLSLNDRKNLSLLREFDMDISRVESEVMKYKSSKTRISQSMEPFRKLLGKISVNHQGHKENLKVIFFLEAILPILQYIPMFCVKTSTVSV